MEEILLIDKDKIPNEQMVRSALKESYVYYEEFYRQLAQVVPKIKTEWKYYGKKNGWLLKHLDSKRNLFFLITYDGYFKLSFTFGEKAISEIDKSDEISKNIKELLKRSKKYVEGTSLFLKVSSETDVKDAILLVKLK